MNLSAKAFKLENSKGRFKEYDEDAVYSAINPFVLDSIKLLSSKSSRRLAYKTQVFNKPYNKHIRTRKSHTEEVEASSMLVSNLLGLNIYLCSAIAKGHDLGHFPFGHTTEQRFTKKLREENGKDYLVLDHSLMGLVILHQIEREGAGLNLMYETMEGILNHSTGGGSFQTMGSIPEEYKVVRYADKIAYLFSDINDAERLGTLNPNSSEFKPIYDNLSVIMEKGAPLISGFKAL